MRTVRAFRRRRAQPALAVLGALLLVGLVAGCGLPLPDTVQRAGKVSADPRLPEPIEVLPPGPQPGVGPERVVQGFLAAQRSAQDRHGIARSFLAPEARAGWQDDVGVTVYDSRTPTTSRAQPDGDATLVTVSLDVLGTVGADGAARVQAAQPGQELVQRYRLRPDAKGQWQLVGVPPGLTLTPTDRDRSYDALSIYYLAPTRPGAGGRHLVADLLQLPAVAERPAQLVRRLLAGPSGGLEGSVETAVPAGMKLREAVTSADGEVMVDLSGPASALSPTTRQDLSAQILWTLRDGVPDFTRLRLLVDGQPLAVPGGRTTQARTDWASYDPDGDAGDPAGVALVGGSLRSLAPADEDRAPRAEAEIGGVVDFAVDPRRAELAVLVAAGGTRTLSVGPFVGPLVAQPEPDEGLRSPTWGSGDDGLWALRTGDRPAVLRFDGRRSQPVEVPVEGLPPLGSASLLRVSRDGARVVLVADKVLYLGRVERDGPNPRVVGLRTLRRGVLDVAWRTGTVLEVLVEDAEPPLLPLLRLSIDGTSATLGGLVGVSEGEPVSIAAYGDRPVLVETRTEERATTVYVGGDEAGFKVLLPKGSRPSYPR